MDIKEIIESLEEAYANDSSLGFINEAAKALAKMAAMESREAPADKPVVAVPDGWNIVTNENWNIPRVGQRVILFSNGVVQEESYTLDQADGEPGCGYYFWNRDDLEECPEVKAGDMWISWPDAAAPSLSQQSDGGDCAVAAIEYAIGTEEGLDFLRYWFYGEFDVLRRNWDNIPDRVFIGADPLFNSDRCRSNEREGE